MREFFTIAIFKIKADIRMNKTTLNSQKEKHSTLSLRRATKERKVLIADVYIFRSTLSLRRATRSRGSPRILVRDFYPRSPCGERLAVFFLDLVALAISIHALLAESDPAYHGRVAQLDYFYPRSPCGERPGCKAGHTRQKTISIHALLAESDRACPLWTTVSPRFLSTLSLRRATRQYRALKQALENFYPRSPCGERRGI